MEFNKIRPSLIDQYAKSRKMKYIRIDHAEQEILLSPGEHNELIKSIIDKFASRFLHGAELIYVGDTQDKAAYLNDDLCKYLHISFDKHKKSPDVVFYIPEKKWLVLVESVTSHGPMDCKRFVELSEVFAVEILPRLTPWAIEGHAFGVLPTELEH